VPAELIEEIKQRQAYHQKRMLEEITRPFEAGEKLRVVTGPFEGLEAIFDRKLSSAGRCQVLLNILGQLSRVQMEKTDLERIGLHQ
jgi:transcription antitermination factor NusG